MQEKNYNSRRGNISKLTRNLTLAMLVAFGAACGGGGGDGSDNVDFSDEGLTYTGNRSMAVITEGNMGALTANVVSTSSFGYAIGGNVVGGRPALATAPSKLSLPEAALQVQQFVRRSLRNTNLPVPGLAARPGARPAARLDIDETEFCESGSSRITGAIEDDLTGVVEIDYQNCRNDQTTSNGKVTWEWHAVDEFIFVPTRSTFRFQSLSFISPTASLTIGGEMTNHLDAALGSELIEIHDLVVRDNGTGKMMMASALKLLLQYDNIYFPNRVDHSFQSGRIYDSTHGFVDVDSLQALRYESLSADYPVSGLLRLSAVGRLTVTAAPGQHALFLLDTSQPPDGVPEIRIVRLWDKLEDTDPPADDDLDDDNLSDRWELEYGLDPLNAADALLDFDFDGFDSLREFQADTIPVDPTSLPPLANLWRPAPGSTPSIGDFVYLESQPGDTVGAGGTHLYTPANSALSVSASGSLLSVTITGSGSWSGTFELPVGMSQIEPGYYGEVQRHGFHDPVRGGMIWAGNRGCDLLTGWFIVDNVIYIDNRINSIELRFGQHCDNNVAGLRGQIRWTEVPTEPPPDVFWQPTPGITPDSGNYIYLESQAGDYIGQGGNYLYTLADAVLTFNSTDARLSVSVNGDESWNGTFQSPNSVPRLLPGHFDNLTRYPFHDAAVGGLSWGGEGRGCNQLTGWFIVDSVSYSGDALNAIDLRFEQRCENGFAALRGKLHWDISDPIGAPGPVDPPPGGLWQPPQDAVPVDANYVYLESQAGDYIGAGGEYLYTGADAILSFTAEGARLSARVNGDEDWGAEFQAMNTLTRLEPGYYGDLQRYPFHNPVRGGLSWSGEGRGCNQLTGWFIVDSVAYDNDDLSSITIRFEQRCDGVSAVLNGKLHWSASNSPGVPGPVFPPPGELWQPNAGITPDSGNYIYLESQAGDYIGQGLTYLYTDSDATLTFSDTGSRLDVSVNADEYWNGVFQAMYTLSRLEPGYYGNLQRHPFHNSARGGMSWSGEHRSCNQLNGWFVVDSVTYNGIDLTSIELRFEQVCDSSGSVLNGKLRWSQ